MDHGGIPPCARRASSLDAARRRSFACALASILKLFGNRFGQTDIHALDHLAVNAIRELTNRGHITRLDGLQKTIDDVAHAVGVLHKRARERVAKGLTFGRVLVPRLPASHSHSSRFPEL